MVIGKVALEAIKSSAKVYIRDAGAAYSTAFLGGVVAGAGYMGLKDGIQLGKKLPGYAKTAWRKVFKKKTDQNHEQPESTEFKPEEPTQE